jgi:acetylornithine deacetylase/succinyl-diaminopimelate desuccinylase-like protein
MPFLVHPSGVYLLRWKSPIVIFYMEEIDHTGLIFIPSKDGISHNPIEHTDLEDVLHGIEVLEAAILHYAKASPQ